ncbi:MAG: hypothetical protein EBY49_05385, partial [Actinobacteria bacterium]|nr:hypothetical protein [Actinomycetota bacterium]
MPRKRQSDLLLLHTSHIEAIMAHRTAYPAAVTLAYDAIMRSEVFRNNGPQIDLPRALALLGDAVHNKETPEGIWSDLGEFTEA